MAARPRAKVWLGVAVVVLLAGGGWVASRVVRPVRPSFLLFIMDTTRFDAVSANGRITGTTPVFDRLAAEGVRYTNAYAHANWTAPSHATLFTGLLPRHHGVVGLLSRLPDGIATLAQRLADAGYETVSLSENPWIGEGNGLVRGFERFTVLAARPERDGAELLEALDGWLAGRRNDRPFFLFVNVMDAHWQYQVRPTNPFLPSGVDAAQAAAVSQVPSRYLCRREPLERDLAILHGLYLGGVAAADRKLGQVVDRLRRVSDGGPLVSVVTSDHGEHFGEHRLVIHNFGVYEELIHVPLLVHGLGEARGVVRSEAVGLADIGPSLLAWAGLPVPGGLVGRPLPLRADAPVDPRIVVAEYTELEGREKADLPESLRAFVHGAVNRDACRPEDRMFGDVQAVIDHPMKLLRYADGAAALFDLSQDPGERHDRAAEQPARVTALLEAFDARAAAHPTRTGGARWTPDPALAERLRALGYVGHH